MKYFPFNADTEQEIKAIKNTIRLSMNGVTSDSMKSSGLNYKVNYGLSLPQIKEIATYYKPNPLLAERLWNQKIRETMILATLLYPKESFTPTLAEEWISEINTVELCEQYSFNLLQHVAFGSEKILDWISSNNPFIQITALLVSSRINSRLKDTDKDLIIQNIIQKSTTTNFSLYHAMSVCLRFFCRMNKNSAQQIIEIISSFKESTFKSQQYIFEEVKQEVEFYFGN